MPLGTPPGIYKFNIYAVGDGAVFGEQEVTIRHCNLIVPTGTPTVSPTPTGTWSTPTVTPIPVPVLDCSSAVHVPCGGGTFSGNTSTGSNDVDIYSPCTAWFETGKENVYRVDTTGTGDIIARLSGMTENLDVFILDDCDENSCIAFGNITAEAHLIPPGTYYVVVDGYEGAEGNYTLTISSSCSSTTPANKFWLFIIAGLSFFIIINYKRASTLFL